MNWDLFSNSDLSSWGLPATTTATPANSNPGASGSDVSSFLSDLTGLAAGAAPIVSALTGTSYTNGKTTTVPGATTTAAASSNTWLYIALAAVAGIVLWLVLRKK